MYSVPTSIKMRLCRCPEPAILYPLVSGLIHRTSSIDSSFSQETIGVGEPDDIFTQLFKLIPDQRHHQAHKLQTFNFDGQCDAGSLFHLPVTESFKEARWNKRLLGICQMT